MGWCTVAQVREHNAMLATDKGWDTGRIQRLIDRQTRSMKAKLHDAYYTHFGTWDANDCAVLPPILNDLCLQLVVAQGYIMAYRSAMLDVPVEYFIERTEIEKQITLLVNNLEILRADGSVVSGTPTSCEIQDYPASADDPYHDHDGDDVDRWGKA